MIDLRKRMRERLLGKQRADYFDNKKANAEAKRYRDELQARSIWMASKGDEDEVIVDWCTDLWEEQDDNVVELAKEWMRNILYCENFQNIEWNTFFNRWFKVVNTKQDKIRSTYPIINKIVQYRATMLTENKPIVKVNAATTSPDDVYKAQYMEDLFLYHWMDKNLQQKILECRLWAAKCGSGFLKVDWSEESGARVPMTKFLEVEEDGPPVVVQTPGGPIEQPGPPVMKYKEFYVIPGEKEGEEQYAPVEDMTPDENNPGQMTLRRQPPPPGCPILPQGDVRVQVVAPFELRFQRNADLKDSWYVQHGRVMSGLEVVMEFPDSEDLLKKARISSDNVHHLDWRGFMDNGMSNSGSTVIDQNFRGEHNISDQKFFVLETFIFPKNPLLRNLWGDKGAHIVVIGEQKYKCGPLPEYALDANPFIQFLESIEEGNHYGKSLCRDLVPIQDDINRIQTLMFQNAFARSRPLLMAPQNHGLTAMPIAGAPYTLVQYKTAMHKPEMMQFPSAGTESMQNMYATLINNISALSSMNEASQGKLPAAGIAAKTVFALQYADQRSFNMTSNLQDDALRYLAKSIAAVCRTEYTETRKLRIVGENGQFLLESEISPDHLDSQADYIVVPGSMLAINKEARKNELIALQQAGIPIPPDIMMKGLASGAPDAFRESYDPQVAHARNMLFNVTRKEVMGQQPEPWDSPEVHMTIFGQFLLDEQSKTVKPEIRNEIARLWQAYQQQAMAKMAPPPGGPQQGPPAPGGGPSQMNIGGSQQTPPEAGAQQMEDMARAAMEGPSPVEAGNP